MQRRHIVEICALLTVAGGLSACLQPTDRELREWVAYAHTSVDPKPPEETRAEDGTEVVVGAHLDQAARVSDPSSVRPADVDAVFVSRSGVVVSCFRRAVLAERATAGTLRLRFEVTSSGYARGVEVVENSTGEPVGTCVKAAVGRWAFPAPSAEAVTVEKSIGLSMEGRRAP